MTQKQQFLMRLNDSSIHFLTIDKQRTRLKGLLNPNFRPFSFEFNKK